jgi:putative Ca2+/H+ antiporter (TMEM165/GDT1 family)
LFFPAKEHRRLGGNVLYVFIISFGLIFIGELADKSQLLALCLATRYRAWQVLTGIFVATLVVHTLSALAGQLLGAFIPAGVLPWVSGVLFVGFGVWTLRGDSVDDVEADRGKGRFGPVMATAVAFFFAELGDKTQIMTMAIAADPGAALLRFTERAQVELPAWVISASEGVSSLSGQQAFWMVTLGSTLGMVVADALAILLGSVLGKRLPEHVVRRFSGAIFILFGVVTIASSLAAE